MSTTGLGLIRQGGVLDTATGEVYPSVADAPTPVLLRIIGHVQHEIDQNLEALYEAKRALGGELVERMDKSGEWTMHAPGVKVIAPSPSAGTEEWDGEELERICDELVAEGLITREAQRKAVTPETVWKTNKRGITALMKIPAIRERVRRARRYVPQGTRKVSVRVNPRDF